LVFDAKGGEIWRSDVWFLGGAHFFACIWNFELLHWTCMFNFNHAWTLDCL
jgi:hypothetical protein